MKLLHLGLDTLMLRFYLMMAIVIIAGFAKVWLLALLALPVFFSCLMGIQFKRPDPRGTDVTGGKVLTSSPIGQTEAKNAA